MNVKKTRSACPYGWLFLGAGLFIAYGSLVPLHYQPMDLRGAFSRMTDLSFWDDRIRSKSDWAANFLMMIPVAYFALGFFRTRMGFLKGWGVTLAALLACISFSFLIEGTQVFFPPRVPSLSDLSAQVLGAVGGIVVHWWVGTRVEDWVSASRSEWRGRRGVGRLLKVYVLGYFVYQWMPLDLTLSPADLFRKWRDGRVYLVPWTFPHKSPAAAFYQFATDVLLWAPVCALFLMESRMSKIGAVLCTIGLAAFVEGLQLLVFSRITDTTDIVAAAVAAVAIALAWRSRPPGASEKLSKGSVPFLVGLTGFCVWCFVLVWIFWYPFNFTRNGADISARLEACVRVPLVTYFYRSELQGLTEILRRLLWYAPLGFFAFGLVSPVNRWRIAWLPWALLILLSAAVAFGVELGQVALPGKVADVSNALLGTIGAVMGCFVAARVFPWIWRGDEGIRS